MKYRILWKTIATIAERREGERRGARERGRVGEGNVVNAKRERERTMAAGRVARGTSHDDDDDDDDARLHDWRMMSEAKKDRMYEGGNETCSHCPRPCVGLVFAAPADSVECI